MPNVQELNPWKNVLTNLIGGICKFFTYRNTATDITVQKGVL